jgi:hypothetical protein
MKDMETMREMASDRRRWQEMCTVMLEKNKRALECRVVQKRGPRKTFSRTVEDPVSHKRIKLTTVNSEADAVRGLVLRIKRRREEEIKEELEIRLQENNGVQRVKREGGEEMAENFNFDQRRNY